MKKIQGQCRICLDDDDSYNLIIPCKCKGTSIYVHKECLNLWRYAENNQDDSNAFNKCGECQAEYQIIKKYSNETFFITRSNGIYIGVYYATYYLFIFVFGFVLSKIDINSTLINSFNTLRGKELLNPNDDIEQHNLLFYFAMINSLLFFMYLIIFFICINIKVKRRCKYWKHNILIWLISFLSVFFIIPIYIYSNKIRTFNVITLTTIGFNLLLSLIQINTHNKVLYDLNHNYNTETYIEYPLMKEI
uniref:RING-CH-type domain-containing protein n=1 Tax=viral metagenome TaxID=1070528 RepID=A0A6C0KFA0_9ZZZZ